MRIITKELIEKFKLCLYEEEKSKNTIEKYIRDVNFFSSWLCGDEVTKKVVVAFALCRQINLNKFSKFTDIISSIKVLEKKDYLYVLI